MKDTAPLRLTPEQISDYQQDGFLVLKDLIGREEIDAFLAHQETRSEELNRGVRSHVVDPQWQYLATHPNVAGTAAQILDGTPCIVQTMYMARKDGENARGVSLHQDTHHASVDGR